MLDRDDTLAGTPLFDDDNDAPDHERHMAGPSENTSRLIRQHSAERTQQGRDPYWPDRDK